MAKVAEPRNDAYTGLLGISLLAMIIACVLLYMDYSQYEGKTPPKTPTIDVGAPKGGTSTPTPTKQDFPAPKTEEKKAEEKKETALPRKTKPEAVTVAKPTLEPLPPAPMPLPTLTEKPKASPIEAPKVVEPIVPVKAEEPAIKMPEKDELSIPAVPDKPVGESKKSINLEDPPPLPKPRVP